MVSPQTQSKDQPPDAQISPKTSLAYWSSHPPTVNTMLGGYPQISRTDLRGSASFYAKLLRLHPRDPSEGPIVGVDCGAGIGRVTAGFLSTVCDVVDVLEPVQAFAQEAKKQKMEGSRGSVGEVFMQGLESWTPKAGKYDLIWNQWCTVYLTDAQFVAYLRRCGEAMKKDGWIVVKENTSKDSKDGGTGEDVYDAEDSSVTRTDAKFLSIFEHAGMKVLHKEVQRGFPKGLGLYPVRMYALRH